MGGGSSRIWRVCVSRGLAEGTQFFLLSPLSHGTRVCCHDMSHWRRADPFSDAERLNLRLHGQLFQCFRLTPSQTVYQGAFQKPQGLICPGATRANAPGLYSRGSDPARQVDLGWGPWGSSVQIPRCHMPHFQNVCPEVRGPRPLQVPNIPEPPCSLQQPLQALEQAPANSSPCSDAEPAPLSDFSVESAVAGAESVLPSEVFLPASTAQPPVCVAASCSCKAPWFNWPAVPPTAQDVPNPSDNANHDIANREKARAISSSTSLGLTGPYWHI